MIEKQRNYSRNGRCHCGCSSPSLSIRCESWERDARGELNLAAMLHIFRSNKPFLLESKTLIALFRTFPVRSRLYLRSHHCPSRYPRRSRPELYCKGRLHTMARLCKNCSLTNPKELCLWSRMTTKAIGLVVKGQKLSGKRSKSMFVSTIAGSRRQWNGFHSIHSIDLLPENGVCYIDS